MKRVIISGASGFVGRHLMGELLRQGIEVFAIARKQIEIAELAQYNINWVIGDLFTDKDLIIGTLESYGGGYDCFYHLAWNGVSANEKNNYDEQIKNIEIGMNALNVCRNVSCDRFINLGTVGEYVSLDGLINEKWVPSPADIYGAFKVAVRNILAVEATRNGMEFINTILCSTYGEHRCDDNVISYTIKQLLAGNKPQYGALEQMWDFLYVEDVAYALYLIGEKGTAGKTYSIGSGIYRHLYEYVETIRDQINPELELGIGELGSKYQKVLNSCVDTFQLQKDTGFKPRYSFEEGIQRTISYFQEIME